MLRPWGLLILAGATIALGACGSGGSSTTPSAPRAGSTTPSATACRQVPAPAPKAPGHLRKPRLKLDRSRTYTARMTTNCGEIDILLDVRRAPRTTASFVYLVRQGFYDSLTFHRISPGFVIQGGDPTGTGTGGPGYRVVEPPPPGLRYTRGVVAMAKAGAEAPGTSGSQFYIVTAAQSSLTPDYALLGQVVKGADVVAMIAGLPTGGAGGEQPLQPVVIEKLTIEVA